MDIIKIYAARYPDTSDAVMETAAVYDAAAVREAVAAVQRAAEKDAARPDHDHPDLSRPIAEWAGKWRPKKTPEAWAEQLHDRLCGIVRRGYAAQYTPAQMAALLRLLERGVRPVCVVQESSVSAQEISVEICPGCSVTADDLRRISADIHAAAPYADTDILRMCAAGDFRALLDVLGLSQSAFARRYGVPLRTVQHWAEGSRKPPEYLLRLFAQSAGALTPE